jgi:hypothetical protein
MTAGKRYQYRGKDVEVDALRIEMIKRGLTYRDLAAKTRKQPQRIANVLAGSDTTWPIRVSINRALKMRIFRVPHRKRQQSIER